MRNSASDREYLLQKTNTKALRLSISSIDHHSLFGRENADFNNYKQNVINFAEIGRREIAEHDTYRFLSEVVGGTSPEATELYQRVASGSPIMRSIVVGQRRMKVKVRGRVQFLDYYASCVRLAESIAKHGILDLQFGQSQTERDIRLAHRHRGSSIGVAIDHKGRILHHTSGHHRIALARLLNVGTAPVSVAFVSGAYFKKRLSPADLVSEKRFLACLKRRIGCALGPVMPACGRAG